MDHTLSLLVDGAGKQHQPIWPSMARMGMDNACLGHDSDRDSASLLNMQRHSWNPNIGTFWPVIGCCLFGGACQLVDVRLKALTCTLVTRQEIPTAICASWVRRSVQWLLYLHITEPLHACLVCLQLANSLASCVMNCSADIMLLLCTDGPRSVLRTFHTKQDGVLQG